MKRGITLKYKIAFIQRKMHKKQQDQVHKNTFIFHL